MKNLQIEQTACLSGVADPECLTRILTSIHLGFRNRIQRQIQREMGVKKNLSFLLVFCSYKYHKTGNYGILFLSCLRKKFTPIYKAFLHFLPKMLSLSSQKYGVWIRDPRSPIRIRNTGFTFRYTASNLRIRVRTVIQFQCKKTYVNWNLSKVRQYRYLCIHICFVQDNFRIGSPSRNYRNVYGDPDTQVSTSHSRPASHFTRIIKLDLVESRDTELYGNLELPVFHVPRTTQVQRKRCRSM